MSSTVIAGKPSNTVGEKDSVLILRGSSVRVQWGNKFIDLIKNGKVNAEYDKILKTAESVASIKSDGIYLIEDQVWLVLNDTKVQLAGDKSTVYVSFVESQETTEENKITALKNIGFYYNTIEEAQQSGLQSGIIYVLGDNKLYTIINGQFSEYSFQTNQEEKVEESISKTLYIKENSLWTGEDEYIKCENNQVTILKQLIIENGIYSPDSDINNGFRLYIKDGRSYLEVDEVIERDPSALTAYEFIKIFSEHSNVVSETQFIENDIQCILQENNLFKTDDYIYIVGSVEADSEYKNGIISITLNKESSVDIKGTLNGKEIIIPAGTTQLYVAGPSEYELKLNIEKELFEYKIKNSTNQTILIENGDTTFYKNCKYVYSSRKPLIKIHNNNLSVVDRSIQIDNKPDETIHTRIGIIEEDNIEQLKEGFKELKDRPKVGVFSDNFIGLNSFLYNSTFKTIRKDKDTGHPKYPVYDKKIDLPKDNLLIDNKFNYSVPDIEWIKKMMDLWIPIGTIVMFDGKSEIPPGWAICNGDQGTPNLIGRFVKADYETGKIDPEGVIIKDNVNKFKIEELHLPYHAHPHTHTAYGGTYSDSFYDDYATSAGSAQSGSGASLMTNSGSTDSISITIPDKETSREIEEIKHWSNDPITIEPKGYKLIFIMKVSNWYNKI